MSENLKKLGFEKSGTSLKLYNLEFYSQKSEIFLNNYTMNYFFFTLTRQFTKYKIKKLS